MKLNSKITMREPNGPKHTFPPGTVLPDWCEAELLRQQNDEGRDLSAVMVPEPKKAVDKKTKKKDDADGDS